MTSLHLADRVLPVLIVVCAVGGVIGTATRLPYFSYDEGVYFHQAAEWARGRVPYTEYFVPQPPGILGLGWLAVQTGAGIGGVRAFTLLCGILLLYQTFRLAQRISVPAAWSATGFLASTAEWTYISLEAATQAPATVLMLSAVDRTLNRRSVWAGTLVGIATVFRIQAATLLPGLVFATLVRDRSRVGWVESLKLTTAAAVVTGLIHGVLTTTVVGYWDGVFGFQLDRPRMSWTTRSEVLAETFSQVVVILGLLSAAGIVVVNPEHRPLAILGLVTTGVTAFAGNSLFRPYFVAVLPVLAVCGAVQVQELLARFQNPARTWAVIAVLTAASGIGAIRLHAETQRSRDRHLRFLEQIQDTPAEVWLTTDGRLMEITGKRMVRDHLATDPGGLFVRDPAKFQIWFRTMVQQADAIAITDLLAMILDTRSASEVLTCGKPMVFESEQAEHRLLQLVQ